MGAANAVLAGAGADAEGMAEGSEEVVDLPEDEEEAEAAEAAAAAEGEADEDFAAEDGDAPATEEGSVPSNDLGLG